jgi:hypothetical protein
MAVTSDSVSTSKYASVRYLKFDWSSSKYNDTTYTIDWTLYVVGRTSSVGYWDLR